MNQPPTAAAALPLIALILGVIGFCIPPLFPIAIILAIVSLVKASEPAYAARKTLAIITLVLGFVYIPVVGVLAALAIPNFIRFQVKSKQVECKTNLRSAWSAQQRYFGEKNVYGESAEEIGFKPEGRNRYTYRIGPESIIEATLTETPSRELEAGYPRGLMSTAGIKGDCPECSVTMLCAGNIDADATIDADLLDVLVDNAKAVKWLLDGAQPTERVKKLLEISGAWAEFGTARAAK